MSLKQKSAVEVLKTAHKSIKKSIDKFDNKMSGADKEACLANLSYELTVLCALETEVFYPAIGHVETMPGMDHLNENHDRIKVLLAQEQRMMGDEPAFDDQFKELTFVVKRHFQDMEDVFHQVEKAKDSVDLRAIGEALEKKQNDITAVV